MAVIQIVLPQEEKDLIQKHRTQLKLTYRQYLNIPLHMTKEEILRLTTKHSEAK